MFLESLCLIAICFLQLVRRIIRQTFEVCKKRSWDEDWVKGFAKVIQSVLLESKITIGFGLHVTELYLEELAKVHNNFIQFLKRISCLKSFLR